VALREQVVLLAEPRPYLRNQFPTSYQFLSPGPHFQISPYQNRAYQAQQLQQRPPQQVGGYQKLQQTQPRSRSGTDSSGWARSAFWKYWSTYVIKPDLHSVPSGTTTTKLNLTVLNIRNKLVLTTVKPRTTRTLIRKIITTTSVIKRDSLTKNTIQEKSLVPRRIPATHTTVNLPRTLKHLSRPTMSKPSFYRHLGRKLGLPSASVAIWSSIPGTSSISTSAIAKHNRRRKIPLRI
jgi:hypothetical protein